MSTHNLPSKNLHRQVERWPYSRYRHSNASLEYKNDAIGHGILHHLGLEQEIGNAF